MWMRSRFLSGSCCPESPGMLYFVRCRRHRLVVDMAVCQPVIFVIVGEDGLLHRFFFCFLSGKVLHIHHLLCAFYRLDLWGLEKVSWFATFWGFDLYFL